MDVPRPVKEELDGDFSSERSLLANLIDSSRLYRSSKSYFELLEFVTRLRNFAPFNAMLLQIQKPGLRFAASEIDWRRLFNRTVDDSARPLVILWPFGPVAFVYDVADTSGPALPDDVQAAFRANGPMTQGRLFAFFRRLKSKGINCGQIDFGDGHAGDVQSIQAELRSLNRKEKPNYKLRINVNHNENIQFSTLIHELGHLFLGHLGPDMYLRIPARSVTHRELEAESVSYIVCERNGVETSAAGYLSNHIQSNTTIEDLDIDSILRAAGQIESILELTAHTSFGARPINYPLL